MIDDSPPDGEPSSGDFSPVELDMPTVGHAGDDEAADIRKINRPRRIFGISLLLLLAYAGLAAASPWFLEQAEDEWRACSWSNHYEPCELDTSWLGRLTPSTYVRHDVLMALARYKNAERAVERAVRVEFDSEARDAAAAALIESYAAEHPVIEDRERFFFPGRLYGPLRPVELLVPLGAHAAVIAGGREHDLWGDSSRHVPLAALALGDLAALAELWGRPLDLYYTESDLLEREAWGCLLASHGFEHYKPKYPTLATHVCSGTGEAYETTIEWRLLADPDYGPWWLTREIANARRYPRRWLLDHPDQPRPLQTWAQAIAPGILLDEPEQLAELVTWLEARGMSGMSGMPNELMVSASRGFFNLQGPGQPSVYAPQTMVEAARMLASVSLEQHEAAGAEPDADRDPELLRTTAGLMAAEAALEFARRGRSTQAHEAALLARDLLPARLRWIALGPLWLSGDSEAALTLVAALRKQDALTPERAQLVDELELRALTQLGRFDEALARVNELLNKPAAILLDHVRVLRTWQRALAIQVGEPLPGPAKTDRDTENPDLALILQIEAAELTGAAHAKIETLLDTTMITALEDRGRSAMWARAEAARWRGDSESEARWRERLAKILAVADTDERAMLLDLARF